MKKISILIVMLVMSLAFLGAQTIAEYTFSNTTDGTLEDMTGSTDLLTAGTYYDDTASPVTNIGFTFSFGMGAYTQFSANSNGQMQLGATAISGGSASPSAGLARLAPLSGDNAIRATGMLHYKLVGEAPNRKLVVEWLDLRVNYSSSTETGTYCRMQAWLYETSNNIKFVYGTMYNMSTYTQSRGVYVSTSNVAGSVGNVTDILNTMAWTNTATSVTTTTFPASSYMANLNSTADGSRRVFHINYPVYTTPPNTAVLLGPANGLYALQTDALTWQSGGGGPTSYDVYFGTNPTPPFVANQAATSYAPILDAGTTYYWNIVAKNAFGDAAPTATWSFNTPTATQLVESFENTTFPPAGWANGTTGNWSRSTSYYKNGVASAYKYGSTSTQYILSTPKVTITPTSMFNLWTLCSSTSGTLQIVYSPDRTTWTQLGSNITYAATNTWYNTNVDLSSLAGNNYYLGVRTGLQAASFYTDMYIGPELTSEAPGAPVLSTPADLAINVNEMPTIAWTAPTTGGIPTGYRLYVDTVNPPTTVVTDQMGLSYTYTTPLAYNTTYYWTVEAYNTTGTGPQATVFSFTTRGDPHVSTFPYTVNFDTETPPALPLNWIAAEAVSGASYHWKTTTSDSSHGPAAPNSAPNFAYLYCYLASTTYNPYYLISPPINLDATAKRLTYWYWIGSATETNPLLVDISTDQVNWTNLYTHSNASNTNAWYQNTISLEAYTNSTVYLRYAGVSNYGSGMCDLGIDDIVVEDIPAAPICSINPASWDFGTVAVNSSVTKDITITNTGGGILDVSSIAIAGDYYTLTANPAPVSLGAGISATFTVQYNPTAQGTHNGTVTITDSRAVSTVNLTGISALVVNMATGSTTLAVGENWNFFDSGGPASPYQTNENYTYTFNAPTGYRVHSLFNSFATESGWDHLYIYDGPDATATLLGDYSGTVTIPEYSSTHSSGSLTFVFTSDSSVVYDGWSAVISLVEVPAGPPEVVTLASPATGTTGLPETGFNLTWTPATTGGTPTYFAVYMSQDEATIYEDQYWETTNTYFNPVTEGLLDFQYNQRWYWTVEAVNNDGSAVVEPPIWFEIMADPHISLPYTQDFGTDATPVWPLNWTQTSTGSEVWDPTASSNAGGTANEMTATWTSLDGTTRLITPPINTTGVAAFAASFNTMYDDYGTGITAKVQYSHDLNTWYDTPWSIVSGTGNVSGYQTALISGLADQPTTYVAWVLDGNHFQFDYWYVDDVALSLPPDHDVTVISYDIANQVVPENTMVIPMATVGNNGINTETFNVTCTIGTYSSTATVTGLPMGQTQQVTFASLTPELWTAENVVIATVLATDQVTENDTLYSALICLPLDTPALANNAQTDQFVQFNLANPGVLNALPNTYTGSYFIAGADWANGNWMGVEYDDGTLATDNYYEIDPLTGTYLPSLGEPGAALMGIAYDDTNNIMYGVGNSMLYTMDVLTGLATAVDTLWYNLNGTPYSLADISGLMIDIAFDNANEVLYGVDLGNDCLWTIDPTTCELTLVGFLGIDLNYAQDAAFDQDNGLLFLAGYAGGGALYWIDTTYGGAYKVGALGTAGYELTAFAIPYGNITIPAANVTGAGTLSWTAVDGAVKYSVYSSNDPYGDFVWTADVYGTTWTDPNLAANAMKFYQVTAVGGMRNDNREEVRYTQPLRNAGKLDTNSRYNTGLAW
jgi:hypothetical protein